MLVARAKAAAPGVSVNTVESVSRTRAATMAVADARAAISRETLDSRERIPEFAGNLSVTSTTCAGRPSALWAGACFGAAGDPKRIGGHG